MRGINTEQRSGGCTQLHLGDGSSTAADSCLPSTSRRRRRRRCRVLNLELPADEYIERGEADATVEVQQEDDIELALTIGSGWRKREETYDSGASFSSSSTGSGELKTSGHGWELQQVEDVSFGYGNGFELEALRASRLKQPPWHLQCLSLRMTWCELLWTVLSAEWRSLVMHKSFKEYYNFWYENNDKTITSVRCVCQMINTSISISFDRRLQSYQSLKD